MAPLPPLPPLVPLPFEPASFDDEVPWAFYEIRSTSEEVIHGGSCTESNGENTYFAKRREYTHSENQRGKRNMDKSALIAKRIKGEEKNIRSFLLRKDTK